MKKLMVALLILALPIALVFITGTILPEKHSVSVTDTIQAPQHEVYKRVTHISDYSLWRKSIQKVVVFSESEWIEIDPHQDTILYRMTILEEHQKVLTTIVSDNLPYDGHWIFKFVETKEGHTALTITENGEVYKPVYRFFGRFVFGYDASIKEYIRSLKRSFGHADPKA